MDRQVCPPRIFSEAAHLGRETADGAVECVWNTVRARNSGESVWLRQETPEARARRHGCLTVSSQPDITTRSPTRCALREGSPQGPVCRVGKNHLARAPSFGTGVKQGGDGWAADAFLFFEKKL